MKTIGILTMAALSTLALAARTSEEPKREEKKEAKAELGKPAPDFELKDVDGKAVKLSDYKGKTVVLEWFNPECPYVVYAHTKGPLKGLDAKTATDGVVWLAINSSAAGKEGSGAEKNKKMRKEWNMAATLLIDEEGVVGRMYGAKSTPHMYIVDSKGNLAYRGGLDNAPMGKVDTEGTEPVNYVETALAELKAGKAVSKSETKAYGCGVKYATKDKEKEKEKEKVKE
jgi:peroxiredoxin